MTAFGKLVAGAAIMATIATPASAQRYWLDFGVNAGGSMFTALQGEAEHGVSGDAVSFGNSWLTGSQLTLWPLARIGLRGNFAYADRSMSGTSGRITDDINLWSLTGDLLIRLRTPAETFEGREVLPYLALGAGWKWHDPAGDEAVCYDRDNGLAWSCLPYTVPVDDPNSPAFAVGELTVPAAHIGVGADVRFSKRWAMRVELSDRIFKPETQLARFEGGNIWLLPNSDENTSKLVHEIGLQAGIHILLIMPGERAAVMAAAPAQQPGQVLPGQETRQPPGAGAQPPAGAGQQGPPPPREDDIAVCVVDPTATNGLRMQNAKYLVGTADTVVEDVSGRRIQLDQAVGELPVARTADWHIQGTPFVVQAGDYRAEFLSYGEQLVRRPDQVTYLGMVNGYATYADSADVEAFRPLIVAARAANRDFTASLSAQPELRTQFDDLGTIYVPFHTTGCSFQPLLRQEPVRKGGDGEEAR